MGRVLAAIALLVVALMLGACRVEGRDQRSDPDSCGDFANAAVLCDGVWVRAPRFVPQGLALGPGHTAYISGYKDARKGHRYCRVVKVDRRTGRVLARVTLRECRHGGGIVLADGRLWLAGAQRLWLLDPDRIGRGDPVVRAWRVERPLVASTIAVGHDLALGQFNEGTGRVSRFSFADLQAPEATTLIAGGAGVGEVAAVWSARAPGWMQGMTAGPGGLWFASSSTYCGVLTTPHGDRIGFLPGAEGLDFDASGRLWAVSESGSEPYQRHGDRPAIPTLTRVAVDHLDRDVEPGCDWDGRG